MASQTEQQALPDTLLPAPGELFVEETPKPFADSLREILEEYRSNSSPARYAMAVELGETDDWELYQGPQPKRESFYPVNGAAMQSLLHDSWIDQGAPSRPPAEDGMNWLDILHEFRSEPADSAREVPSAKRELPPMTKLQEQSDRPAAAPDALEEALPQGIHTLSERRSAPLPETTHLSVEDILAEFRSEAAAPAPAGTAGAPEPKPEAEEPLPAEEPAPAAPLPAEEPVPAEPLPAEESAPAEPEKPQSRKAGLEAEARSLFAAFRRGSRVSAPEEPEHAGAGEAPEPAPSGTPEQSAAPPEEEAPPAKRPSPVGEDGESGDAEEPEGKKPLFEALHARFASRRAKKEASAAPPEDGDSLLSGIRDEDVSPAAYAPDDEYEQEENPAESFPSFGEYLLSLVTGLWVRLRGVGGSAAASQETMETESEELGEEVKPAPASRYYGSFVQSLRLRCRLALALWLIMAYLTLGMPATGMLRTIDVAAGMILALQLGIMLLALDVVVGAGLNLTRGRFGADALAVLACLLTCFDALGVALDVFGTPHVPLCLFSSFSLYGVLLSSQLSARGLRKALRVPAIGKSISSVTAEAGLKDNSVTLITSQRPVTGFVRRSEEAAPDETAYTRAAPALLILAFVLSLALTVVKHDGRNFLFVLSALLVPAVPVTALLCFALPFLIGAERIFPSGAAIAGWSGLCDIGGSHNLIVTDRDLFPDNNVEIDSIRIFADEPSEKVIAYAGSMITASGCGLGPCFAELMERNACSMRQIEDFEILPGGGMRGVIDGQTVLCGGMELMRLMDVRIPYRLVAKTAVLLAIDGTLYGIFNLKYAADPRVRKALVGLMRSNRHAIFAIRDFNINPTMLHETFELATDGYDFPPYLERFSISQAQPAGEKKIAAVLCREGLGPLVHMADTGRSMFLTVRLNLFISLLASVFGVLAVFLQFLLTGSLSVALLFLYSLACFLLVAAVSIVVRF